MSHSFQCGDEQALIAYLYDECSPEEHRAAAAHLARCGPCAEQLSALEQTRSQLATWAPPEVEPGVIVPADAGASSPGRPSRWWQHPLPAWAQAVAAVAIFGVGLSLGVVRGRVSGLPEPTGATAPASPSSAVAVVSPADLRELEQRLRTEMQTRTPSPAGSQAGTNSQVLERVRALIQESEERQQRELAFRTAQIMRDVDAQRRVDLAQIERTFGQMEGTTGVQAEQQRQLLNYLMRVSQTPR